MKSTTGVFLASVLMLLAVSCVNNAPKTEHVILIGLDGITPAEYETPFIIAGKGIRQGARWTSASNNLTINFL